MLRETSFEVRESVARLRSRLATHNLKRVAPAIVAEVRGVAVLMNQTEFIAPGNDSPSCCGDGSQRRAFVPTESSFEVQAEPPTRKESRTMLVLGRKVNETIIISDNIRITVLRVSGNQVRIGVEAPENVNVIRMELFGPGDAGPEAGEPPIPRSLDGRGTDSDGGRG